MTKIQKTDAQWSAELTPEQFRVLRQKGTRSAVHGEYDHVFEPGTYRLCRLRSRVVRRRAPSTTRAAAGPPSTHPRREDAIDEESDVSHGMIRTEVMCANCGGHLGHVFPGRPGPDRPALLHQLGLAEARGRLTGRP